jgi:hypothetical protein
MNESNSNNDIKFYTGIELSQELLLFKPLADYDHSYRAIKKVCTDFDNEIEQFKQTIVKKYRKQALEYRSVVIDRIGEMSQEDLSDTSTIIFSILSRIAADLEAGGFEPVVKWESDLIDIWGETPIVNAEIVEKVLG